MSKKIFRSIVAVAMIVLLASLIFTSGFLYDYFNKAQISRLKEELSLAKQGVENSGIDYFNEYSSNSLRFTLITPDGSVIYDSQVNNSEMDNHIEREEIKQALQSGSGSSARYSSTLTERTFYEAVLLKNGNILRISSTQVTIATLIVAMLPAICAIILFSVIIAIILSQKISKSIVKPLEILDLENPENNDTYEELSPVLAKLNAQRRKINSQLRQLKRKSDELKQITDSLSEGLVLLDKNADIITINIAAEKIFNAYESAGQSFLNVERGISISTAVKNAICGEQSVFVEQRNGKEYRFTVTPIISDEKILGAVILCIDISEAVFAERNRKEFTANVSHELKTPLQSIIGSAELLESGLVKQEDTVRFIGNIKSEAKRLVALINDIIRLSQLDEKADLPKESVDLYREIEEAVDLLKPIADKNGIKITIKAGKCTVTGVRRYIYEIIYNLLDNAIRYNKPFGEVEIAVKEENGKTVLQVSDTGIGIPDEHKSRIFERFYRVDKSHSKETGGTGLGLSIVKHAAECLKATVELESKENCGTTVTVEFN